MSLYGALYSGVAGLKSQSSKIGIVSDNISNVNTVGYKGSVGQFETLVTTATSNATYSPGGVLSNTRAAISKQGLLQATDSPTDIAIAGDGFFVVNGKSDGSGSIFYTRAGSFRQDSTGNFRNAAGFYLQAWPLDREGRLPGETGNTNTASSANLTSLQTVNVQNLTGAAAATTTVSIGANLNAGEVVYPGAAGTIIMDGSDNANFGIKAKDIIAPQPTGTLDRLTRNDQMKISTGTGLIYTYTYGGFTFGRDVTDATSVGNGDNGANLLATQTTLTQSAVALPTNPVTTGTAGSGTVTITTSAAHGLAVGDVVTLSGLATTDGITAGQLNTTFVVASVPTGTTFTVATAGSATAGSTSGGGASGFEQPRVFKTTNASGAVTVRQVAHGLSTGAVVTLSGVTSTLNGITAAQLNGSFVITVVDADHYTITTTGTASSTGGGDSGTVVAGTRPFVGNILDATNVTTTFLGTTGTSGYTASGLTFKITTAASGTVTFSYTSASPNSQLKQFNNLTNLAAAINGVPGLSARVVNGRLYVGATDADAAVSFQNGSTIGVSGPPVQAGIDWVRELGLQDVTAGSSRFNSMQSLADQVNESSGLDANVKNPLGASTLVINVADPLDTITFADDTSSPLNTGSVVAALGLVSSLGGAAYTPKTYGPIGPAYDAGDSNKNMASGAITAQWSRPVRIFDSLGTGHDLTISYVKTAANTWAVEVYAVPASDITSALVDGQIAVGNITFNGDGSLRSVDDKLSQDVNIVWTNGAIASKVSFDWGTAGEPFGTANAAAIGKTDGLSQFNTGYKANFTNQNGAPVGELTGVNITEDGIVVASYSNGETQNLFKIPLADFANPDQMTAVSGNVYSQSAESGEVNLREAGTSGVGKVASSALEASNVELAEELTAMIVAQRAYQANTKVITAADDLLEELTRAVS